MSLLTAFDLQPDELLYSALARYADAMDYPTERAVLRAAFASTSGVAIPDFPGHLNAVALHIAKCFGTTELTGTALVRAHTVLPHYVPFVEMPLARRVQALLCTGPAGAVHAALGIMASRIRQPTHLRYCHECIVADTQACGVGYWHRTHQLPGVLWCVRHGELLRSSTIRRACPESRLRFASVARVASAADPPTISGSLSARWRDHLDGLGHAAEAATRIGRDMLAADVDGAGAAGLERLWQCERAALTHAGFVRPSDRLLLRDLRRELADFYSDGLLTQLGCRIEQNPEAHDWLGQLARRPRRAQAPLYHLLLHRFLKTDLHTLFRTPPRDLPQPTATVQRIVQGTSTMRPGRGRRVHRDEVCDAQRLAALIADTSLSLRAIARVCAVTPKTVQRWARRSGLWRAEWRAVPRPPIRADTAGARRAAAALATVARHRAAWLSAIERPSAERQRVVRALKSTTYVYLWRYDHAWLKEHRVAALMPSTVDAERTPRVDWTQRDRDLLAIAQHAVASLRAEETPWRALTCSAIIRRMGVAGIVSRHRDQLPMSVAYIKQATESRRDFARRKLALLVDRFAAVGTVPARWVLVRIAGLRSDLARQLDDDITETLETITERCHRHARGNVLPLLTTSLVVTSSARKMGTAATRLRQPHQ